MSQQAVVEPARLLRQRARWAQGNLQCARYAWALAESRHVGSIGLLDVLYYLTAPWLTVPLTLLVLAATTLAVVSLVTGFTFGGLMAGNSAIETALTMWITALFAPGILWGVFHRWRIGDEPLGRCLLAGLCYPGFLLLGTAATWRAVSRHLTRRRSWVKTDRHDDVMASTVTPLSQA